jgi:hypothetical protein
MIFIGLLSATSSQAQTCCSAGAPISNLLDINNAASKTFSLQLNYEYKSINRLIDNSTTLTNDPRTRFGQNASLKLDYSFNERFAISTLLPLVHQSRATLSESQSSVGLGDLTIVGQYKFLDRDFLILNAGLGVKLATGVSDHRSISQIILSPDMQSGSGSTDYIFRLSGSRSNFLTALLNSTFSFAYKLNNANSSFASTPTFPGRNFAFGDEALAIIGFNYQHIASNGFWVPDVNFKYRWTDANIEQQTDAPNSGGYWLSIPIGLSYVPSEKLSIRAFTEIPIFQKLNGLQITTDYTVGFQLNYTFKTDNDIL